ncbi:MAG: hypothetical protein JXA41_02640 [Deltaproteobacteria bacterium]|nr:hypothetical protein [Deltaproteobacteria bacterium]
MSTSIKIIVGKTILSGELYESPCARQIIACLPIETNPDEWGDEFYFSIPVRVSLDDSATPKVKIGDIGYWPPGTAMAIFFGSTPMSTGGDPVPASAVNLVGRVLGDATVLKRERGADKIRIEKADP